MLHILRGQGVDEIVALAEWLAIGMGPIVALAEWLAIGMGPIVALAEWLACVLAAKHVVQSLWSRLAGWREAGDRAKAGTCVKDSGGASCPARGAQRAADPPARRRPRLDCSLLLNIRVSCVTLCLKIRADSARNAGCSA